MQIIAVMNEKGGCGRTTVAINLAAAAARLGHRVLVLDLDPQNHAAIGLGAPLDRLDGCANAINRCFAAAEQGSETHERLRKRIEDNVWTAGEHLNLLPLAAAVTSGERRSGHRTGGSGAAECDTGVRFGAAVERMLEALEEEYDWCVIDTPAGRGPWAEAAGRVASDVIVPFDPSMFGLLRLESFIDWIQSIGPRGSRYRRPLHLLPSIIAPGRRFAAQIIEELDRRYPDAVMPVQLTQDDLVCEAAGFGRPVIGFAPDSDTSALFRRMVRLCRRPRRLRTRAVAAMSAARRGESRQEAEVAAPVMLHEPPIARLLRQDDHDNATSEFVRVVALNGERTTVATAFLHRVMREGIRGSDQPRDRTGTSLRMSDPSEHPQHPEREPMAPACPTGFERPLVAVASGEPAEVTACSVIAPGPAADATGADLAETTRATQPSRRIEQLEPPAAAADPDRTGTDCSEGATSPQVSPRILELVERTRRMTHSTRTATGRGYANRRGEDEGEGVDRRVGRIAPRPDVQPRTVSA